MELVKVLNHKISWFNWEISRNRFYEFQLTASNNGASVVICHSKAEADIITTIKNILQGKRILQEFGKGAGFTRAVKGEIYMDKQEILNRIDEAIVNLKWIINNLDNADDSQILESLETSGQWEYSIIKELRGF